MQQTPPTMLDMIAIHYFACVKGTKPFEVLLLEGQDGQTWKDHMQNFKLCHVPNVDGQIDPSLVFVPANL